MLQNCCTHQVWTVPPSPELLWITLGMGKNPTQQPKIYSFSPPEKSSLIDLNLSLAKVSFLPDQTAISSPSNTCHANLTNQCLLNVTFSMTKALNDWSSPKLNFHSFHLSIPSLPQMLFWKPCFFYCLFFSFSDSLFISNFKKFQLTPLQLGICDFVG